MNVAQPANSRASAMRWVVTGHGCECSGGPRCSDRRGRRPGRGWLTVLGQRRHQEGQRAADRARWRDEIRREAYNSLVIACKQLSASWWKMADLLWDESSSPEQWQAAWIVVHDAWVQFSASTAAVSIAGPSRVAQAAEVLRRAMSDLENAGMDWYSAARREGGGRLTACDTRFKEAMVAKREPDLHFQQAARRALGTEDD